MSLKVFLMSFLLCIAAQAATWPVQPSGNCSTDMANLQNAASGTAAGDTIELQPSSTSNVFDLTCATGSPVVVVTTPDLYFTASSPVILQGPAVADYSWSIAFMDRADNLKISGLTIRNFNFAILSNPPSPTDGLSVSNSHLENNTYGIWSKYGNTHVSVINNTVVVPHPADPDPTSNTIGILVLGGYAIVAGNTVTGPGAVMHFNSAADLNNVGSTPQLTVRSAGIWQIDYLPRAPISYYSLFSNNHVSGLDLGMQVSSTYGATVGNTVTHCATGLGVSQDSGDPSVATRFATVTQNTLHDNQIGFLFESTQDSTAVFNDFQRNSVKDIVLMANPGGPVSKHDLFVLSPGSRQDLK